MEKTTGVSKRSIWSALGLMTLLGLTYLLFWGYLLPGFTEIFGLDYETATIRHLGLILVPLTTYLLIAGNVCLAVNIFRPLRGWREDGLIVSIILGLFLGLSLGLISGLVNGLMWGNLIHGLMVGLIVGLSWALFLGLSLGLILILFKELR